MSEIPKDIRTAARGYVGHNHRWLGPDEVTTLIARAILAERRRCAAIVRDNQTIVGGEPCEPFMDEILRAIEAGQ